MKKTFILLGFLFLMISGFSQSMTARFQGKIKQGSSMNAVMIVLKSDETFTGQWTNVQFVLQVPNTVSPQPVATIKSNPLSANIGTANYIPLTSNEGGFYNYLFSATTVASPTYTFANEIEIDVLEIQFTGGPVSPASEVRMAQLANGGTSTQMNFYVEISGNDNTNTTAMFFGAGSSNNAAGYAAYSYTPLSGVVLPVTWGNVNAGCTNKGVKLNWQTYSETNADRFEIEKATNGVVWKKIGSVLSAGNSSEAKYYLFYDEAGGDANYRLKLIDKDGKFSYSSAISINCSTEKPGLNVYPIPARNFFNVTFSSEKDGVVTIRVADASGKIVLQQMENLSKGTNTIRVNSTLLNSGLYYLKIVEGENTRSGKIMIVQ